MKSTIYFLLRIWSKIKLLFVIPAFALIVMYKLSVSEDVRNRILSGDFIGAMRLVNIVNMDTGELSSDTKHVASIFWLFILILILIF